MVLNNKQSVELTLENHYFTRPKNSDAYTLEFKLSASFLVVLMPDKLKLIYEDLYSENPYLNILQTNKRSIGDYTYDADDRIAFDVSSLLKKGYCTYVICVPILEKSTDLEAAISTDVKTGFDFIIKKENSTFSNYDSCDEDNIQKTNPIFSFLNACSDLLKITFYRIYCDKFNIKRFSFMMNSNPIVLMKLFYDVNNTMKIDFPIEELVIKA
jgi:hypothetical protein